MNFKEFYEGLDLPTDMHKEAMELAWMVSAAYARKKAVEIALLELENDQNASSNASSAKIARQIMDEMTND